MSDWQKTLREEEYEGVTGEVSLVFLRQLRTVRLSFIAYATTVDEAKAAEPIVNQLLSRLPALEATVATAAFAHYLFLVEAFRTSYGDQVQLPEAADAEALKPFYQLTTIYLPNEPEAGYFGLGFECEFEEEHGMGMRFRNWQIEEVADHEAAFSFE